MPAAYVYQAQALAQQAQRQHYLRWFYHLQTHSRVSAVTDMLYYRWSKSARLPGSLFVASAPDAIGRQPCLTQHEREFSLAVLLELDWGLCGNGSIVPLKASSPVPGMVV